MKARVGSGAAHEGARRVRSNAEKDALIREQPTSGSGAVADSEAIGLMRAGVAPDQGALYASTGVSRRVMRTRSRWARMTAPMSL